MRVKNSATKLHFRPESCKTYQRQKGSPSPPTRIKLSVLFGSLGAPSGALLLFEFASFAAAGNSVITACFPGLKPGVHQHSDLWLLLAAFVLATCYTDLKPGVRQQTDVPLLLAAFVITTCYLDLKPAVRILAAAGNLRPQDFKITGPNGRCRRTPALKRRGGMGAAL